MVSALLGTFAGMALVLMAVGVYGLLAFTTAQRPPELRVRAALGATRRHIREPVLSDATWMTGAGILIGVAAAFGLGRFIADQLFGVTPTDPATLAVVVLAVVFVVGVAAWLPALRAGRVEPMVVLRHE